ncbi:hypothetical protein [Archangium gephyra]|nr:hypothetical protein [Archangium gephyra]
MSGSRLAGSSRPLWVLWAGLLGLSCVSARSEPAPVPSDAGVGLVDAGLDAVDAGPRSLPCAPDEMDCCGICIPRSEGRCPANIQCRRPAAPPVEAER